MNFNSHSGVEGQHAFLSPSNYHWINYDDQKLEARFRSYTAARRGSELHEFAKDAIRLGIKLSRANPTMSMYVKDGIDYKMAVEQPLYFSENCFGTTDTISFNRGVLRIHDLKTGLIAGSFHQLEVYAALFCLEYGYSPFDIRIEFRIYQNKKVEVRDGDPKFILDLMDLIIYFDSKLQEFKMDGDL